MQRPALGGHTMLGPALLRATMMLDGTMVYHARTHAHVDQWDNIFPLTLANKEPTLTNKEPHARLFVRSVALGACGGRLLTALGWTGSASVHLAVVARSLLSSSQSPTLHHHHRPRLLHHLLHYPLQHRRPQLRRCPHDHLRPALSAARSVSSSARTAVERRRKLALMSLATRCHGDTPSQQVCRRLGE